MAPSSPSWVLLGASWPQHPTILAPTWLLLAPFGPILAPTWPFQGRPKMAKSASKRNLEPRWGKIARKTAPRPSQTPPGRRFSQVWGSIFSCFSGAVPQRGSPKGSTKKGLGTAVTARRAS